MRITIRSDSDNMLLDFPTLHSSNFVFNDSMTANGLEYKNGRLLLPIAESSTVESSEKTPETKFEVPDYIPKFKFKNFAIDSLMFITEAKDCKHEISTF